MECGTAEVIMGGGTGGNKMPHKRETTGGGRGGRRGSVEVRSPL